MAKYNKKKTEPKRVRKTIDFGDLEIKPPSFTKKNPFIQEPQQTEYQKNRLKRKQQLLESATEFETNPNQMKGESNTSYGMRKMRFDEKRRNNISPFREFYEDIQKKRDSLPYIPKIGAEILMSPIDIAESVTDYIDISDTQKYKSSKDKRQDIINLADSILDAASIPTLGVSAPIKNMYSYLVKTYGNKVLREVLGEEVFNELTEINQNNP